MYQVQNQRCSNLHRLKLKLNVTFSSVQTHKKTLPPNADDKRE